MSESTDIGDKADADITRRQPRIQRSAEGMPTLTRIVLEENDDIPPTGLPVSINGRAYIIVPGEPVDVPQGVIDVLNNAIMNVPQIDPNTRRVVAYRPRMRFPYRTLPKE